MDLLTVKINNYINKIEFETNKPATNTDIVSAIIQCCSSDTIIKKKIKEFEIEDSTLQIITLNMLLTESYRNYNTLINIYNYDPVKLFNNYGFDLLVKLKYNFGLFSHIIRFINPDIINQFVNWIWDTNQFEYLDLFEKVDSSLSVLLFIDYEKIVIAYLKKNFEILEKYIKVPHNYLIKNLKKFIDLSLNYDDGDYLYWLVTNIPSTLKYQYDILMIIRELKYKNYKQFKLLCLYNSMKIMIV